MRWSDTLESMSPEEAQQLVNALTIGLGLTALAVRRMAEDAPTLVVARALLQSHTSLRGVLVVLQPALARRPDSSVLLHPPQDWAPPARWGDFLAGITTAEQDHLRATLAQAVRAARQTGEDVLANTDHRQVASCLVTAVRALASVRRHLLSPVTPFPWR